LSAGVALNEDLPCRLWYEELDGGVAADALCSEIEWLPGLDDRRAGHGKFVGKEEEEEGRVARRLERKRVRTVWCDREEHEEGGRVSE
jgi:hypothetical protein